MEEKDISPDEENFHIFCNAQEDKKYKSYLNEAELLFSRRAQDYAIKMGAINNSVEGILKETGSQLEKINKNTKKKLWDVVSSMLGTAVLFCLMASLSFLYLYPAEREGMKPLQYIGRAIDKVLWDDELNKK